jgi:hypothetical protein
MTAGDYFKYAGYLCYVTLDDHKQDYLEICYLTHNFFNLKGTIRRNVLDEISLLTDEEKYWLDICMAERKFVEKPIFEISEILKKLNL